MQKYKYEMFNYHSMFNYYHRNDAKKALKTLMGHQDFDILFYQDVDWKIISSIEKQLISLKYSPIHTV